MKTILRKSVTFKKDGTTWPVGTAVNININQDRPTVALINRISNPNDIKKARSRYLYKWFNEFQPFTMEDMKEAIFDGVCPSLTGTMVEPDGWDSEGMPSILLACGMC